MLITNINPNLFKSFCYVRCIATRSQHTKLKKQYQILGVSEDCDDETLRLAFVHLAKKFHPDSGNAEANTDRFSEIESAYREIQQSRNEKKDQMYKSHPDAEEFDIKHTAPQHRHYLAYDMGLGTPSMRHRRYMVERAQKAVENVMEHRMKKLQVAERNILVGMDKIHAKDIKMGYGIDRLVEDLIQEAMKKGEFNNLPGAGKPLKNDTCGQNPYVDFTTHKLNKIMIDNGFVPEWICLSKEIRRETENLQKQLTDARNQLGNIPLNFEEQTFWENTLAKLKLPATIINKNIDKYNLLVPVLQKQMLRINLQALADASLHKPPVKTVTKESSRKIVRTVTQNRDTLISILFSLIFGKKGT